MMYYEEKLTEMFTILCIFSVTSPITTLIRCQTMFSMDQTSTNCEYTYNHVNTYSEVISMGCLCKNDMNKKYI